MKDRGFTEEAVCSPALEQSFGQETHMTRTPRYQVIPVKLGDRSYDIMVSYGCIGEFGKILREKGIGGHDAFVFTSPRIGRAHFGKLKKSLKSAGFKKIGRYNIPDGEKHKTPQQHLKCIAALAKAFPDPRNIPLIINLGGGVVGDIGGYVAGTFRRGIDYVQIPTTLLGCVDCGVGGKVGVNEAGVKNLVGIFHQPRLVFADLELLKTLPKREIRSGMAEVIKYGAVLHKGLFEFLEENVESVAALDRASLSYVVEVCFRLKASIVENDEQDRLNQRIVLNFGHTVGHAVELSAKNSITHGEAISIGMVAATGLAVDLERCDRAVYDRIKALLEAAGLPTSGAGYRVDMKRAFFSIQRDKKSINGSLRFVIPTAIGNWTLATIADLKVAKRLLRDSLLKR